MATQKDIDEPTKQLLASALSRVQAAEKSLTPIQEMSSLIYRAQNCLIEASVCLALAIARSPQELRKEVNIFAQEKRK